MPHPGDHRRNRLHRHRRARDVDTEIFVDQTDDSRPGPALADIRAIATAEPQRDPAEPDWTRVPTRDETTDVVGRAQRALVELERRQALDAQRWVDEAPAAKLARRYAVEQTAQEAELALD